MSRKVGIIGVGHVGAHCAFSLCLQGLCDELVLVDSNEPKAASEAHDLCDCMRYLPHRVKISVGTYGDVHDCDIVIISAGVRNAAGCVDFQNRSRLQGLQNRIDMVDSFLPQILDAGFQGIFIVISNPCDILAHHIWKTSGFAPSKVFATGTMLDSARFCQALSRETGLDPQSVTGYTMGEHGDSQIAVWSHVSLGGKPLPQWHTVFNRDEILKEVRRAAWDIADGKGATEFGISTVLSKVVQAIYWDSKAIFPLSTLLDGEYGKSGLFISTPCVLGRNGIEEVIELDLPEEELIGFQASCDTVKSYLAPV